MLDERSIPLAEGKVLKIVKEEDERWTVTYRLGSSYSFTCASKDYVEALREVYRYAKSKRATDEELKAIEDVATSDMFEEWARGQ